MSYLVKLSVVFCTPGVKLSAIFSALSALIFVPGRVQKVQIHWDSLDTSIVLFCTFLTLYQTNRVEPNHEIVDLPRLKAFADNEICT